MLARVRLANVYAGEGKARLQLLKLFPCSRERRAERCGAFAAAIFPNSPASGCWLCNSLGSWLIMLAAQPTFGLAPFYRHFTNDDVSTGREVGVAGSTPCLLRPLVTRGRLLPLFGFPAAFRSRSRRLSFGLVASGRCTLDPFQAEMRVFSTVSS